jgi:hypothetical protein
MRAALFTGATRVDLLLTAAGLNILYFAGSALFFLHTFRIARRDGLLMRIGE